MKASSPLVVQCSWWEYQKLCGISRQHISTVHGDPQSHAASASSTSTSSVEGGAAAVAIFTLRCRLCALCRHLCHALKLFLFFYGARFLDPRVSSWWWCEFCVHECSPPHEKNSLRLHPHHLRKTETEGRHQQGCIGVVHTKISSGLGKRPSYRRFDCP